jgi:hypothetical protein
MGRPASHAGISLFGSATIANVSSYGESVTILARCRMSGKRFGRTRIDWAPSPDRHDPGHHEAEKRTRRSMIDDRVVTGPTKTASTPTTGRGGGCGLMV